MKQQKEFITFIGKPFRTRATPRPKKERTYICADCGISTTELFHACEEKK